MARTKKEQNIYEKMYENRQLLNDIIDAYEYGKFNIVEKWDMKTFIEKGIDLAKLKLISNEKNTQHDELRSFVTSEGVQHKGVADDTGSNTDNKRVVGKAH